MPVDFAVVAAGVIRGSFPAGEITTSDVFNVSSLGSGADGTPGYPLISVWLTGKELKDAFEVDASVTALMPEAQIYGAGMTWTWNPHRMMFNKVTDCAQVLPDGSAVPIDDDRLYRVVTGLYTGQMLGTVNDQSFGILAITPKDAQGNVITDYRGAHYLQPQRLRGEGMVRPGLLPPVHGRGGRPLCRPRGAQGRARHLEPLNLLKTSTCLAGWPCSRRCWCWPQSCSWCGGSAFITAGAATAAGGGAAATGPTGDKGREKERIYEGEQLRQPGVLASTGASPVGGGPLRRRGVARAAKAVPRLFRQAGAGSGLRLRLALPLRRRPRARRR